MNNANWFIRCNFGAVEPPSSACADVKRAKRDRLVTTVRDKITEITLNSPKLQSFDNFSPHESELFTLNSRSLFTLYGGK